MKNQPSRSNEKNSFVFPDDDSCVVRDVLKPLTSKWSMLVMFALMAGPMRFSTLQNSIESISKRMLTVSLRQMEREGYIEREVFAEVPPRVEYRLSELGQSAVVPLIELISWAGVQHDYIRDNRQAYDLEHNTEHNV